MSDTLNPYSPPQASVDPLPVDLPRQPASKGRRFGTFVVDYLLFMAMSFVFGVVVALGFGEAGMAWLRSLPDLVLGAGLFLVYYLFFEGLWARTPGKLLFGTVVVNEAGGKPSLGQVLGRTVSRFIPFEALSTFGERPWHDSLPKTRVVMARTAA